MWTIQRRHEDWIGKPVVVYRNLHVPKRQRQVTWRSRVGSVFCNTLMNDVENAPNPFRMVCARANPYDSHQFWYRALLRDERAESAPCRCGLTHSIAHPQENGSRLIFVRRWQRILELKFTSAYFFNARNRPFRTLDGDSLQCYSRWLYIPSRSHDLSVFHCGLRFNERLVTGSFL